MKLILIYFVLIFVYFNLSAQVTTIPPFPVSNEPVTITFDATQGTGGLANYTGDVYAHTGVITDKSTSGSDWKYVIADWNVNTDKARMTRISTNIYQLQMTPDIRSFYGVPAGEQIKQMAFVFRNADGSKEGKATGGKDIYVDVYQSSLAVSFTSPTNELLHQNESLTISAISSSEADLVIKLNETLLSSTTGSSISTTHTCSETGYKWLIASATLNGQTAYDSMKVCISPQTTIQTKPSSYKKGINYLSDTEVGLVLEAPGKSDVYVLGDFNNWLADPEYQMKKDGELFWLTISNLNPQQEYIFQYWIDGAILVGDPYCDKISDPWDDSYITDDVYPNLIDFPAGTTEGRASVLQTGQLTYDWHTTSWSIPDKANLHIYELLIRDFTEEGTYQAVIDKLDYLDRLGVNAIELMPFNEFEGNSSWGYNPNYYFAPDKAYGTKDDLKELIDSIHNRGMIIIQDIVLNHAYNSSPMVKMYWDDSNNRPAPDNPWFNQTSPNPVFSWGSDFNHESPYTQAFVDSVTSYWLNEYKVDGFRFDFTKGFTNKSGDGWAYDASRIGILKRIADHIWSVKTDALVILEHFAENSEEKELCSYNQGPMLWGHADHDGFYEAAMGWNESGKSDLSWASYQARSFSQPGLVAYMESHDEERLMYKNLQYGNASGAYNIKELTTALDRNELAAAFFFCLAGPKMIWQFGELGYDYSINENGRVGEKPVRWDYLNDPDRLQLFNVYSAMIRLRELYPVFTAGAETRSLAGALKSIQLAKDDHHITLIGNFDVTQQTISAPFQHAGIWFEFFSGEQYTVNSTIQSITLAPGEYRLYSDQELPQFNELATDVDVLKNTPIGVSVFPNPASTKIRVQSDKKMVALQIFTIDGKLVKSLKPEEQTATIQIDNLQNGVYLMRIHAEQGTINTKFIKSS